MVIKISIEIYQEILREKERLESEMLNPTYVSRGSLNEDVTYEEIACVVQKLKCNKAVGFDGIANEVLKNESVTLSLCAIVKLCFDVNCFPTSWLRSIITPVPKAPVRTHMFHFITEVPVFFHVSQKYLHLKKKRISTYLDSIELIEDGQN